MAELVLAAVSVKLPDVILARLIEDRVDGAAILRSTVPAMIGDQSDSCWAPLHQVHNPQFGLDHVNGYFGPLFQDNRPVATNR